MNPTDSWRSKAAGVDTPWEYTVPSTETAWCLGVLASFVALIRGHSPGPRACKGQSERRLSPTPRKAQGRKPGKRTSNSSGPFSLRTSGLLTVGNRTARVCPFIELSLFFRLWHWHREWPGPPTLDPRACRSRPGAAGEPDHRPCDSADSPVNRPAGSSGPSEEAVAAEH